VARSLFQQAKDVERQIGTILSVYNLDDLIQAERELITTLKHHIIDARLEVRDYEYAETRADQTAHAVAGRQYLKTVSQDILKSSEFGLFSAVDVAQLSGQLDTITDQLS
jgi:hypothetical protein